MHKLSKFRLQTLVGVFALVAALMVGSSAPTAAANVSNGDDKVTVDYSVKTNRKAIDLLSRAQATNLRTGETRSAIAVDPPPNGCDWTDVSGNFHANYLEGILTDLTVDYQSDVSCTATEAGQSMENITNIARLYKDTSTEVSYGILDQCNYAPSNPCLFAISIGAHVCVGDIDCAGIYQVISNSSMLLPDGWVWTSWDEDYCTTAGGDTELFCRSFTGTATVPLVYPG